MEQEVNRLNEEVYALRKKVEDSRFTPESFKGDDEKVSFYTGLPSFVMLMGVFNMLEAHIQHSSQNSLEKFEEMMVFLMRLRLYLPLQDLAYRFHVSASTVSRVFEKWLNVCYDRLSPLIRWPTTDQLTKTMPVVFRENFGTKVTVILDCFEVFIDRPSSLITRAATWSQYKHHNTVKFLIGICPQGSVTFLSKAYGGRASDKTITEDCGFLALLEYGDMVLADRGFLIAESVGMCCATLHVPSSARGKRQLGHSDVIYTRELANVRIHVERVIGLVRNKFSILKGPLPVEFLKTSESDLAPVDKIATVCSALVNLCNSVVPLD